MTDIFFSFLLTPFFFGEHFSLVLARIRLPVISIFVSSSDDIEMDLVEDSQRAAVYRTEVFCSTRIASVFVKREMPLLVTMTTCAPAAPYAEKP